MALSRSPRFTGLQASFLVGSALIFFGLPWYCINKDTDGHAKFQPIGTAIGYLGLCAENSGHHKCARKLLNCALKAHIGDISVDAGYAFFASTQCQLLLEANKVEKSLKLERRLKDIYTKLYGTNSYPAMCSSTFIAIDLRRLTRYREAAEIAENNLKAQADYGLEFPDLTIENLYVIADSSLSLGQIQKADDAAKNGFCADYGDRSLYTRRQAQFLDLHATSTLRRGNYLEAQELYKKQIDLLQKFHPAKTGWIATDKALYAYCCQMAGMNSQAAAASRDVYALQTQFEKSTEGCPPPLAHNIALLNQSQGHYTEAERLYKLCLHSRKNDRPDNDPLNLLSWHRKAEVYLAQGKVKEASELCGEVLGRRLSVLGENSLDTAASMELMGQIEEAQGHKDAMIKHYISAARVYCRQLGSNAPVTQHLLLVLADNRWLLSD